MELTEPPDSDGETLTQAEIIITDLLKVFEFFSTT